MQVKQWSDMFQAFSKPMMELAELNAKTINKFVQNQQYMENFTQAKKPEDILSAQLEFFKNFTSESMKYTQEACNIGLGWISLCAQQFNRAVSETSKKASAVAAEAGKHTK